MKYLKLKAVIILLFCLQNINAQFSIDALQFPGPSTFNRDLCEHVEMSLNDTHTLGPNDCNFSTDFSNLESGDNTVSISTDVNTLFNLSTLDLVIATRGIANGFSTGYEAIAADFDSDLTLSTDDIILMQQAILGIVTNVPNKAKIVRSDYDFSNFNGYDFDSDFTSITFDQSEVQDGDPLVVIIVTNGGL